MAVQPVRGGDQFLEERVRLLRVRIDRGEDLVRLGIERGLQRVKPFLDADQLLFGSEDVTPGGDDLLDVLVGNHRVIAV